MSGLKPCPFCGGAVDFATLPPRLYRPERNHDLCVVCWECDLYFGWDCDYGGRFDTEQEAAEAWNRRVSDEQVDQRG